MIKRNSPFSHLPLTGWYPGHMLKAGRKIKEALSLVDLVIELRDARIPFTSRNPEFLRLLGDKCRCVVMTKSALVEASVCEHWRRLLADKEDTPIFAVDAVEGSGVKRLPAECRKVIEARRRRDGARRELPRALRIMIVGIPNVGKSTLVNRLATRKQAETGPRPGVTRGNQWVRLREGVELLDTPGVLWPRIKDKETELKLGLTGTIKDELLGETLLVDYLLWRAACNDIDLDLSKYGCSSADEFQAEELLVHICRRRGFKLSGGSCDLRRAAAAFLADFRTGRLGRVVLDEKKCDNE